MPPSPIILIISYWLMRTPGCGWALVAWTAVEEPSKASHADDFPVPATDGDTDARFERGCEDIVCACGGATTAGPGGGVPLAIDAAGEVGAIVPLGNTLAFTAGLCEPPATTVTSPGFDAAAIPTIVLRGEGGGAAATTVTESPPISGAPGLAAGFAADGLDAVGFTASAGFFAPVASPLYPSWVLSWSLIDVL
jgi:hypothetical protein